MGPGLLGDADRTHLELFLLVLSPVKPHLEAQYDVEHEGEGEAGSDDGIANLLCGGEETGEATANLGNDGERRKLAGALSAIVLADLRKLGEKG